MIGNKRQRAESEVAETQVVAADEGDEGKANGDSSSDSQGGDRQNRRGGERFYRWNSPCYETPKNAINKNTIKI
jgi:hypothetical protein